ncbi:MAG: leucine-rich repeat protein [Firmicutes bacterium]|nr:leucine-rich repeat protein [Bacillota bacterium]
MKKFNKIIPKILLVVLFAFSGLFMSGFTVGQTYGYNGYVAVQEKMFQEDAFTKAMSEFRIVSECESVGINGYVYCDSFAGVWYCYYGILNIGVTNDINSRSRINKIEEVVYVPRNFSYNFLNRVHSALVDLMPKYSIHSVAMIPQYNQVEVKIKYERYITNIELYLSRLELYKNEAIKFVVEQQMAVAQNRPIHAGGTLYASRIIPEWHNPHGTISAKAICNLTHRRGIITNAHVITSRCTNIRLGRVPTGSGYLLADRRAQYMMHGLADATFVPFNAPWEWEFNSSASYFRYPNRNNVTIVPRTYQVVSRSCIRVGSPVAKFGHTTGRTEGRLDATRVSVRVFFFSYGIYRNFYDQFRHTARTESGDSGSPVFIIDEQAGGNIRYTLVGTHFASDGVGYASKITNITQELDVTIVAEVESFFTTRNLPNGTLEITGSNIELVYSVSIPQTIGDVPVTRIAEDAFRGRHPRLMSMHIPPTVTSIGRNAFLNTGIWNRFPNNSIVYVDNWAVGIRGMVMMQNYTLRVGTVGIAEWALSSGNIITNITLPSSVNYIGSSAFAQASTVTSVTVANNNTIRSIGTLAFVGTRLWNNTPNNSVVYVGNWATGIRGNITGNYTIRAGTVGIADNAFVLARGLSSINLSGVRYVGMEAFRELLNLTSVTSLTSIQHIGTRAFAFSGLTSFNFTSNIQSFGEGVFENARNLHTVSNMQTAVSFTNIPRRTFYNTLLTEVALSSNIVYIGNDAFARTNLTTITLPNRVNHVGVRAFRGALQLQTVIVQRQYENSLNARFTSLGLNAFENTRITTIRVPTQNCVRGYSARSNWYFVANMIVV